MDQAHPVVRIAVCGGAGVGKSSLAMMFATGRFSEAYDPTVEEELRHECDPGLRADARAVQLTTWCVTAGSWWTASL